jgi:hypothetical protein
MHCIIVIGVGLLVLGVCLFTGHALGGVAAMAWAALYFLPLWLLGAGINRYVGVKSAGYAVSEEAPVFLIVFALPALLAYGARRGVA